MTLKANHYQFLLKNSSSTGKNEPLLNLKFDKVSPPFPFPYSRNLSNCITYILGEHWGVKDNGTELFKPTVGIKRNAKH